MGKKRIPQIGDVVEIKGKEGRFVVYTINSRGEKMTYCFVPEEEFRGVNFLDANSIKKDSVKISVIKEQAETIKENVTVIERAVYQFNVTSCITVTTKK